jgi:hypothetical protein
LPRRSQLFSSSCFSIAPFVDEGQLAGKMGQQMRQVPVGSMASEHV